MGFIGKSYRDDDSFSDDDDHSLIHGSYRDTTNWGHEQVRIERLEKELLEKNKQIKTLKEIIHWLKNKKDLK